MKTNRKHRFRHWTTEEGERLRPINKKLIENLMSYEEFANKRSSFLIQKRKVTVLEDNICDLISKFSFEYCGRSFSSEEIQTLIYLFFMITGSFLLDGSRVKFKDIEFLYKRKYFERFDCMMSVFKSDSKDSISEKIKRNDWVNIPLTSHLEKKEDQLKELRLSFLQQMDDDSYNDFKAIISSIEGIALSKESIEKIMLNDVIKSTPPIKRRFSYKGKKLTDSKIEEILLILEKEKE